MKIEQTVIDALIDLTEQRHAMYNTMTTTLFEIIRPITDGVLEYLDFEESQIEWLDISPLEDAIVLHGMWMNGMTPTKLVIGFPLAVVEQQSSQAVVEFLRSVPVNGYFHGSDGEQKSIPIDDPKEVFAAIQSVIDEVHGIDEDAPKKRDDPVGKPAGETTTEYNKRQRTSKRTLH